MKICANHKLERPIREDLTTDYCRTIWWNF